MQLSQATRWFVHGSLMLLAIWLGSSYLINYATTPKPPKSPADQSRRNPEEDARFRSFFNSGANAFRDGKYSEALAYYIEASQSTKPLTDEQYQSLKTARLQIIKIYEDGGLTSETEMAYRAMSSTALRDGELLFAAKDSYRAVARAQDAEQYSNRLNEGRQNALQESRILLANSQVSLNRYQEAEAAHVRMIDYLKANTDDDKALADNYINLASTCSKASDWRGFEQSLALAIEYCDRVLARYSITSNQVLVSSTIISRNWAEYNLVIAYYREGNTDAALSKADDFFNETLHPQDREHPVNVAYSPREIAMLALDIASESKRQDAVDAWRQKAASINVVGYVPAPAP